MAPRLLLVDDEPELAKALAVRFTASGFVCEIAANGEEALGCIQRCRPDALVVDLLMPVMDGYELCRRLKADRATAGIPVIVLTAVPQRLLEPRLEELGAVRVLHKPFDSSELLGAVRSALSGAGGPVDG